MYYQNYEDYMRSLLGYTGISNCSTCMNNNYGDSDFFYMPPQETCMNTYEVAPQELEELYPEIYKVVYPLVCRACAENTKPITKELIDKMTEDI